MTPQPEPALVVGIGASAGGIVALRQFFAHVPERTGLAYVVILHLSPHHNSQLAEVLQTTASIPVTQVTQDTAVSPDHVYVIPPNQSLSLVDGHLILSPVLSFEERRAPVDIFFRTLAEARHSRAVSVILSGTGPNGSMGLKRVKERGGLVIAQDVREAEHGDMPRNAISTGLVDHVLPVSEIPARILAYAGSLASAPAQTAFDQKRGDQALQEVVEELRTRTGHDFSGYKRAALLRRVERRMVVNGLAGLEAYAAYIAGEPQEASLLLKELLISVTNFFRDAEVWSAVEKMIPRIFQGKGPDDTVRIWVAACATGEEAYTMAMLLADHVATVARPPRIQMFATDIDSEALSIGRNGLYSSSDVADVPPERLRRYFAREHGAYRVRGELRAPILFAVHNVLKDPPFSSIDLVTCRNLLIYLNQSGQERVLETLHFALNPGGWLVLGASEAASATSELFVLTDKPHHIAQSRAVPKRLNVGRRDLVSPMRPPLGSEHGFDAGGGFRAPRSSFLDLHHRLLETYASPSIVINEAYDVVHLSSRAGQYLLVPGGEPSQGLLALIRPELRPDLRAAVSQAIQQRINVQCPGLRVETDDGPRNITLHVRPVLTESDAARGFLLIVFEDTPPVSDAPRADVAAVGATTPHGHRVEDELVALRAQLRAAVEQCEVQAEEFRASAEEEQALNEELRSIAEELETSKEELQSVNEELSSVNQELKVKIEEVGNANSDLHNLINATDIASVFLDRLLRVKLYTPRARDLFNLIPADIGRPLRDLTNRLVYEPLWRDIEGVLERLQVVEREVVTQDGEWYNMRLLPYRGSGNRIEGVVLTLVDITERKRAADAVEDAQQGLALAQRASESALWVWDLANDVQHWSPEMRRLRAFPPQQPVTSAHFFDTVSPADRDRIRQALEALLAGRGMEWSAEFRVASTEGLRWISERGRVVHEGGHPVRIQGIDLDVTARKTGETAQARLASVVELSNDSIVSFDFDGSIVTWNHAAETLFEYTAAEIAGRPVSDVILAVDGAPDVVLALRGAQPVMDFDTRGRTKSGQLVEISVAASPVRDPSGVLVGGSMVVRDLAGRHRVGRRRHDVKAGQAETDLLRQIVAIQDEERSRIARDLHDHLGQELTALRLSLASLKQRAGSAGDARGHIEQAEAIAERLDHDVDFLAYELRPSTLDDEGLATAVERYLLEWSKRFGVHGNFHSSLVHERLAPAVELTLYRITQEALNNIAKHASAGRVDIVLERRDLHAVLIVEDDGRGFDVAHAERITTGHHLGLIGMRERATMAGGTVDFESTPGHGATVIVRLPVEDGHR